MEILIHIRYILWGKFTILFFILTGVYLTFCTRGVQFWCGFSWIRSLFCKRGKSSSGISPIKALCTSLGGTLGVGNLAGVAVAITLGGVGAIFYMLVAAFFGMATKFSEIVLAVRFREKVNGENIGGPMVYLKRGAYHKHLSAIFCIFCIISSITTGAMTQSSAISTAVNDVIPIPTIFIGLAVAMLSSVLSVKGRHSIANIASIIVPIMTILYLIACTIVLLKYKTEILPAIENLFHEALDITAVSGGILGSITSHAVSYGFSKGVFSNEAGIGSAPIAHGCANSISPCNQGVLGAIEVFLDTFIVCFSTALVILVTNSHNSGKTGLAMTSNAFSHVLGNYSSIFIAIMICFLSFTTIIGWNFYAITCIKYLYKNNYAKKSYIAICFISIIVSTYIPLEVLLISADISTALMAVPNLIGIWTLAPLVRYETNKYLNA